MTDRKKHQAHQHGGTRIPGSLRRVPQATATGTALGMVAACMVAAAPAHADDGDAAKNSKIDEIRVEGQKSGSNPYADPLAPYKVDRSASSKLTEGLLDTAKSITVIPKEVIADMGATSFKDAMRTQPGVTLGTGEGGNAYGDRILIRGFDARNDVYVDGIRDPGVGTREIFAVEQIEILKGPSSLFAGRGSTGGAVSLVSKAPQNDTFGDLDLTFGTDNTKRVAVDLNYAVTDKLWVRTNLMYHDSDVAGRDEVFSERWGAALAIGYQASDSVMVSLDYYHLDTDDLPDYGIAWDSANARPFDVDRSNFYGLTERDFRDTRMDVVTGKIEVDLSTNATIRSVIRYGEGLNRYVATAPERPDTSDPDPANWFLFANPKNRNAKTEYVVSQTDATLLFDTGGISHTVVTGVEYSWERIVNRPYSLLDSEDPSTGDVGNAPTVLQNLFNPDPNQAWPYSIVESGAFTSTRVETVAAFLLDTIKFSEQFEAFGGIRYDSYDIYQVAAGGRSDGARGNKADFINWHVGLVYKPIEPVTIYAAVGSSSNPSGEQIDASGADYGGLADNIADLKPERNTSYEVGVKWSVLDQHLLLTAAAFYIEKENARVFTGPRGAQVATLEGKAKVKGFELGFSGNITEAWSIFGGLTVLDTSVIDSPDPTATPTKLPNIAETSFSVLTRYQITPKLHLGGQAIYESRKYGGTFAATDNFVPGYWRFDISGGYEITEHIELSFVVLNVTNKLYYDALYRSGTPFVYVAPGRSALFTLDVDF